VQFAKNIVKLSFSELHPLFNERRKLHLMKHFAYKVLPVLVSLALSGCGGGGGGSTLATG
jgi:hypothetical protein